MYAADAYKSDERKSGGLRVYLEFGTLLKEVLLYLGRRNDIGMMVLLMAAMRAQHLFK